MLSSGVHGCGQPMHYRQVIRQTAEHVHGSIHSPGWLSSKCDPVFLLTAKCSRPMRAPPKDGVTDRISASDNRTTGCSSVHT